MMCCEVTCGLRNHQRYKSGTHRLPGNCLSLVLFALASWKDLTVFSSGPGVENDVDSSTAAKGLCEAAEDEAKRREHGRTAG